MIVLTDWDGSACDTPRGTDYDDVDELLARCTPRPRFLAQLLGAHAAGHQLGIVTARPPCAAPATAAQAAAWLPGVELVGIRHRKRPEWSWSDYVPDKAAWIRELGGQVYIDDRPEGRTAAELAGARFVDALAWERGGLEAMEVVA